MPQICVLRLEVVQPVILKVKEITLMEVICRDNKVRKHRIRAMLSLYNLSKQVPYPTYIF